MTELSCSCGSVLPIGYAQPICQPPSVMTCPGCGQQFEAADDGMGTMRVTVLGRDPDWAAPTFAPSLGIWRSLAMIFMLRKFAESDAERFGLRLRRQDPGVVARQKGET